MAIAGLSPRRAAHRLICQVTGEGRLLSDLLPGALSALDPAERARAQRLANDTLRWMGRADRLLGPHLKKMPPPPVMAALRMAIVEMAVDGAAPHGVVDAAVSLVKEDRRTKPYSGLVNSVLRRVQVAAWSDLPIPHLPKHLRAPLITAWGKESVAAIEKAHAAGAPLDLTPKDGNAAALAIRLGGIALATGSVRLSGRVQVTALPEYDAGTWWVQDAAAAIPARVVDAKPGERVADLCAAPGGKTLQLAATGASVTALDISPVRMARVQENLARTGLDAEIVVADLFEFAAAPFDSILLDAPCSATGTIRRHPDLPHAKAEVDFSDLFGLQARMIDHALALLRPGGRLVYCTCSLIPDEGEAQMEDALTRHPGLAVDLPALQRPGIDPAWIDTEGLRLRPDYWSDVGGMDGFFVGVLRKAA